MNWRDHAVCLGEDPELFFPVGTAGPALAQEQRAKELCRNCPVKRECLERALTDGQESGVWGGFSENERRALRRRSSRARRARAA